MRRPGTGAARPLSAPSGPSPASTSCGSCVSIAPSTSTRRTDWRTPTGDQGLSRTSGTHPPARPPARSGHCGRALREPEHRPQPPVVQLRQAGRAPPGGPDPAAAPARVSRPVVAQVDDPGLRWDPPSARSLRNSGLNPLSPRAAPHKVRASSSVLRRWRAGHRPRRPTRCSAVSRGWRPDPRAAGRGGWGGVARLFLGRRPAAGQRAG